jgi:hypothetical protein
MQNMIDLHKEYDVYADGYEQHDEDMLRRRWYLKSISYYNKRFCFPT